ncbi:MAG: LysM peptidoglycan-binding domain-containing protein [Candidatus Marinimicrobia bacterium]|nr:LysM peptidoglycan-binding domain-containing protein [Candidatus Neomarinimicrobiota bacterium]
MKIRNLKLINKFKSEIMMLILFVFAIGCTNLNESVKKSSNKESNRTVQSEKIEIEKNTVRNEKKEIETVYETDRFSILFNEAKVHFADALIAEYEEDTSEVELQLKLTFESLSDIEVFNNLDEIEYEELMRFTNRLIHDFNEFIPEEASLNKQFSVSDMRESMEYLAEDYIVPDTKEKIKIIEDREGHIPIILNRRVQRIIDYFQTRGKKTFQTWLERETKYEDFIFKILKEKGMPEELIYLAMIESGFKPTAYSYAYAVGQWQFIYSTGSAYGLKRDYWIDERRDPMKSAYAAMNYLSDLYDYFGDWYLAMASYNAGRGRINRAIRYNDTRDFWKMSSLPRETRNYVPTVLAATIISRNPEKYGFELPSQTEKYEYDTLKVDKSMELRSIAKVCNTEYAVLKDLNPELRRYATPNYNYILKIPKGQKQSIKKLISNNKIDEAKRSTYSVYYVRRGDNLSKISRRFGVSVGDIMSANHLKSRQKIYVKQRLIIPKSGYNKTSNSSYKSDLSSTHKKVYYRVKKGDNLGAIAEKFNTRASNIRKWNGIRYGKYIYPGQRLKIWEKKSRTTNYSNSTNKKIYYTVKKGDNLGGIAEQYNTRASEIRKWNNFSYGKTIYPGQKIAIYIHQNSDSSGKYYTVRRGDSLDRISKKTNVSVSKLKKLNPKINPAKIYPGDKIRIAS